MRSPQTLTQRIVPALAVAVVSTLVLGAVVVTADVAGGTDPLLPATFGVAAPRLGDVWHYNLSLEGAWTFGLEDEAAVNTTMPFGTMQWAGEGRVRGGDGFLHNASYFHAQTLVYDPGHLVMQYDQPMAFSTGGYTPTGRLEPSDETYWYEWEDAAWVLAGSEDILVRGSHEEHNESVTEYGFAAGVMAQYIDSSFVYGLYEFPQGESPCMVFNPLQGANVSLDGGIELFEACSLGGNLLPLRDGLRFHAVGVEAVGGLQALRFDARQNGSAYQAWFTPSVPYPVRVEAHLANERPTRLEEGDQDLPGKRSLVLEMDAFQAGAAPLPSVDVPSDPVAELVLAPMETIESEYGVTRIGMEEDGLLHPFPLSEAIQAALASTEFPEVGIYLGHNPDAYVAFASFTEGTDVRSPATMFSPVGYSHVWSIGLSSGKESFLFTASKDNYTAAAPKDARGPLATATADRPLYSFEHGAYFQSRYFDLDRMPYPGRIPAEMPTVVSLAERWAGFDGSETSLNNYGFLIQCDPEVEDDCRVVVRYFAGHSRVSQDSGMPYMPFMLPGNAYGNEESIYIERLTEFQQDGRALFLDIWDERTYRSDAGPANRLNNDLPPRPDVAGSPEQAGIQSASISGMPSAATAWLPEGKEAAGIGFMGVAVGFLYWIWPKIGLMGLFSRLERGELLDHPARQRLVQIVEAHPGIHFHDLALKAELANGTAVHHLRKLSDSGHINVRRSGRYTCYFPGGRVDPHAAAAAPLLKSDGAKQVLEAVRNKPGMSNLELAQATGLQPSTVNYHVQRLSQAGLVAALRDGRSVRLHPGIRAGSADPAAAAGAAA